MSGNDSAIAVCPACDVRYSSEEWQLLQLWWRSFVPATISEPPRVWEERECDCGQLIMIDTNMAGRKVTLPPERMSE